MDERCAFYKKNKHFFENRAIFRIFLNQFFCQIFAVFFIINLLQYSSLYALYLWNHLELDAHIFPQGRYEALDVPFGGLIDFGLGGSIFGAKNYVFGNKSCTRRISGTAWSWNLIF